MTVRVLIVDDQEPFRMAARIVVDATDGFEVAGEAETGEDSVTMAGELAPDLVLMDVNLPGINGLDATRQILTGPRGRSSSCSCPPTRRTSTRPAPPSAAPPPTSRRRPSAPTASRPPGPTPGPPKRSGSPHGSSRRARIR